MELAAVPTSAEEGGVIALKPETGTTTRGETVEAAVESLREATALYWEEFPLSAQQLLRVDRKRFKATKVNGLELPPR